MATYNGRSYAKRDLLSWVGSVEQLGGARRAVLSGGKSDGVEVVDVDTGGGLRFSLLPGRGMDIVGASWRALPLSFLSGTGVTSPAYYEEPGLGWLRSFYGGLLTTCGIRSAGAPSTDRGEAFGLHGRVANAAAEDVSIEQAWDGDEYRIAVRGVVRESRALFENLRLTRTVSTTLGRPGLTLHDTIENAGFEPEPLMMLYHFNFGWPLLGETARIAGPFAKIVARDEEAARDRGVEEALVFPAPIPGYAEKVFFAELGADREGRTAVALLNEDCGGEPVGILMRWSRRELPCFTEWKMPRQGFYVLGLEPGTVTPIGRGPARAAGTLPLIEPLGRYDIEISIDVVAGRSGLAAAAKQIEAIPRSQGA